MIYTFPSIYRIPTPALKHPPAMQGARIQFLGWEDPLEKGYATHSSILGLPLWLSWQRICLQCGRPGFDPWIGKIPWRRERLPTPVFWPGEFHGLYIVHGVAKSQTQFSLSFFSTLYEGFPGGLVIKNLPDKQEKRVQSLGQEDPLEEEMTTHSSILT